MSNKTRKNSRSNSDNRVMSMPPMPITIVKGAINIIIILILIILIANYNFVPTGKNIIDLSEISFTFILALVGITFSISSLKPDFNNNSDKKMFQKNLNNYIFSILLLATTSILTYVVGLLDIAVEYGYIFIVISIIMMLFAITRTLVFLTASYNIDGRNP